MEVPYFFFRSIRTSCGSEFSSHWIGVACDPQPGSTEFNGNSGDLDELFFDFFHRESLSRKVVRF